MSLMPSRTKFRTAQRDRMKGSATRGQTVTFGEYGLQAMDSHWITGVQIEAARVAINRAMKRKGKMWVRAFPQKPISKRPPETRMGHGKGNVEFWVAEVHMGKVLFEVEGVGLAVAKTAFRLAAAKLPIRVRLVSRDN